MRLRTPLLLAVGAAAAIPLLGAAVHNPGVVFEITTTHHDASPPRTEVGMLEIEGSNLAMSIQGPDGEGRMIYRGADREMVFEDHANGTFTRIDEATLERMGGQMDAAMAEMERMLENLPEEQRAMVRQMQERGMPGMPGMDAMAQPEVETRPTGRSETRNGYPADEWEVLEDGVVVRRMLVTPWNEVDGGGEARDAMTGMVEFFEAFLEAMPQMPGGQGPMIRNPFRNMDVTGGMPVWTAEVAPDGSVERESELTSTERRTLPAETFEPDPSLTEQPLPDMGGG